MYLSTLFRAWLIGLFICISGGSSLLAQTTLHGRVVDAETGKALAYAEVFVTSISIYNTYTNDNGIFDLDTPQPALSITVKYLGYNTKVIPITANDYHNNLLNIDLQPSKLASVNKLLPITAPKKN